MSRRRFEDMNCGIGQALEAFGDWWSLLIIRDAFFGARRFAQFQKNLDISTNILTNRLAHLVEHEILERVDAGTHGEHYEYQLTERGRDLLPVLTAMRDWSDRWVFGRGNEPLVVRDRRTGKRLPRLVLRDAEGREVGLRDLMSEPGPGSNGKR
jgi:DNA-binding HxlR family transcriptional regulator